MIYHISDVNEVKRQEFSNFFAQVFFSNNKSVKLSFLRTVIRNIAMPKKIYSK